MKTVGAIILGVVFAALSEIVVRLGTLPLSDFMRASEIGGPRIAIFIGSVALGYCQYLGGYLAARIIPAVNRNAYVIVLAGITLLGALSTLSSSGLLGEFAGWVALATAVLASVVGSNAGVLLGKGDSVGGMVTALN